MKEFGSFREALEFLVGTIVAEAKRESVSLSDVERKMLYFSETDWSLPNILEVNDEFERLYDGDEYEAKITGLIRDFLIRAQDENEEEFECWIKAEEKLREGDYYLLVMINAIPISEGKKCRWLPSFSDSRFPREPGDRLRLWLTALAFSFSLLTIMAVYAWISGRN